MSDTDENEIQPQKTGRPFRRANTARLTPEAAARQGAVTRLALDVLGKDEAIAYLNLISARLGGRPLDLATASTDGLRQIQQDLAAIRSGSLNANENSV